jgi:hypothetical protein
MFIYTFLSVDFLRHLARSMDRSSKEVIAKLYVTEEYWRECMLRCRSGMDIGESNDEEVMSSAKQGVGSG